MSKKVLIVDDEEAVAEAMSQLCQALGLETDVCTVPAQALERLRITQPELVILDLFLPGTDGMKLGAQMRKTPDGARVSFLAVSGVFKQASTARELWNDLQADFIAKPFDNEAFQAKVASRLGMPPPGGVKAVVRRAPRRPVTQAPEASSFAADLASDPIYRIFLRLYEQRASGHLDLVRGKARRRITFHLGQIRHASSNLAKENVGAMQVAQGLIEEENFRKAVDHARKKKVPLAEALVKKKVLNPQQVERALTQQVAEVATASLGWADGQATFTIDHDGAALAPDHRVHPLRAIVDGVRRFYPTQTLKSFLGSRQTAYLVRTPLMDRESYTIRQAAPGERITPLIAGTLTLGLLLSQCPDSDLPLLFTLVATGLLRLSKTAQDSAPPEPVAAAPASRPSSPGMPAAPPGMAQAPTARPSSPGMAAAPPAVAATAPGVEVEQEVDLDAGQVFDEEDQAARGEIARMHKRLEELTHYELFGVSPTAPAESIQKAYLELARQWHSDRFGGRNLGSAVPKLEEIFTKIGEAKEVLGDKDRRADYDVYLDRKAKGLPTDVVAILKAEQLFEQATLLVKAGKGQKAMPLLEQAIELNHAEPEFHAWRGYARFLIEGEPGAAGARAEIERAIAERPNLAWGHYFLGAMALAKEDVEEATSQFKKALRLNENLTEASAQLRVIERRKEKDKGGGLLGRFRSK